MDADDTMALAAVAAVMFIPALLSWSHFCSGVPNAARLKDAHALPRAVVLDCGGLAEV